MTCTPKTIRLVMVFACVVFVVCYVRPSAARHASDDEPLGEPAAAGEALDNAELAELYRQDQADRDVERYESIDWSQVSPRDQTRRERVLAIVAAGGARTAEDYFHAAMVYQHGTEAEHVRQANQWARRAVELDPDHDSARWLAAASEDRLLMYQDKPQKYGTQFRKVDGRWILWEVDPSVTDEERARWNVPPLREAQERVKLLNLQAEDQAEDRD